MAKKAAPQPVEHEPEYESQETPEADEGGGKTRSQADMVRAAVAAGVDKPKEAVRWIKDEFGAQMTTRAFSGAKAQINRQGSGASSRPAQGPTHGGTGIPSGFSADIKELRALIDQAGGADELKELIGQMSGLIGKYGAGGLTELIDAIG